MGNTDFNIINQTLGEMLARAMDIAKPLAEIGQLGVGEMKLNIDEGGRPEQWPPSQRVKKHGGQTLRLTGNLYNSITYETGPGSVAWGPGGTASAYAAIQNFGGQIHRYAHSELFERNRNRTGRFKKGTDYGKKLFSTNPGAKGNTVGEYTITVPARHFDYVSPDAQETFGNIMQQFVVGQ